MKLSNLKKIFLGLGLFTALSLMVFLFQNCGAAVEFDGKPMRTSTDGETGFSITRIQEMGGHDNIRTNRYSQIMADGQYLYSGNTRINLNDGTEKRRYRYPHETNFRAVLMPWEPVGDYRVTPEGIIEIVDDNDLTFVRESYNISSFHRNPLSRLTHTGDRRYLIVTTNNGNQGCLILNKASREVRQAPGLCYSSHAGTSLVWMSINGGLSLVNVSDFSTVRTASGVSNFFRIGHYWILVGASEIQVYDLSTSNTNPRIVSSSRFSGNTGESIVTIHNNQIISYQRDSINPVIRAINIDNGQESILATFTPSQSALSITSLRNDKIHINWSRYTSSLLTYHRHAIFDLSTRSVVYDSGDLNDSETFRLNHISGNYYAHTSSAGTSIRNGPTGPVIWSKASAISLTDAILNPFNQRFYLLVSNQLYSQYIIEVDQASGRTVREFHDLQTWASYRKHGNAIAIYDDFTQQVSGGTPAYVSGDSGISSHLFVNTLNRYKGVFEGVEYTVICTNPNDQNPMNCRLILTDEVTGAFINQFPFTSIYQNPRNTFGYFINHSAKTIVFECNQSGANTTTHLCVYNIDSDLFSQVPVAASLLNAGYSLNNGRPTFRIRNNSTTSPTTSLTTFNSTTLTFETFNFDYLLNVTLQIDDQRVLVRRSGSASAYEILNLSDLSLTPINYPITQTVANVLRFEGSEIVLFVHSDRSATLFDLKTENTLATTSPPIGSLYLEYAGNYVLANGIVFNTVSNAALTLTSDYLVNTTDPLGYRFITNEGRVIIFRNGRFNFLDLAAGLASHTQIYPPPGELDGIMQVGNEILMFSRPDPNSFRTEIYAMNIRTGSTRVVATPFSKYQCVPVDSVGQQGYFLCNSSPTSANVLYRIE